jgi:hypothetical protein
LLQRLLFSVLVLQKHRIAITVAADITEVDIMVAVIIISAQATDGLHL